MPGFNPLSSGQNGGSAWDPYNLARNTLNNAGAKADTGFNPMGRTSSTNGGATAPAPDQSQGGNGNFDYGSAGLKPQEDIKDAASKVKDQVLTQKDFLLLLTTQLQAQDPTKPADNNQLVSQMSQLSMVESLNSINSNMDNVLSSVGASSAMNATNLHPLPYGQLTQVMRLTPMLSSLLKILLLVRLYILILLSPLPAKSSMHGQAFYLWMVLLSLRVSQRASLMVVLPKAVLLVAPLVAIRIQLPSLLQTVQVPMLMASQLIQMQSQKVSQMARPSQKVKRTSTPTVTQVAM